MDESYIAAIDAGTGSGRLDPIDELLCFKFLLELLVVDEFLILKASLLGL